MLAPCHTSNPADHDTFTSSNCESPDTFEVARQATYRAHWLHDESAIEDDRNVGASDAVHPHPTSASRVLMTAVDRDARHLTAIRVEYPRSCNLAFCTGRAGSVRAASASECAEGSVAIPLPPDLGVARAQPDPGAGDQQIQVRMLYGLVPSAGFEPAHL